MMRRFKDISGKGIRNTSPIISKLIDRGVTQRMKHIPRVHIRTIYSNIRKKGRSDRYSPVKLSESELGSLPFRLEGMW